MARPTGRPPKPTEVKRRTGNPGGRKLPDKNVVELLPASDVPPNLHDRYRPLDENFGNEHGEADEHGSPTPTATCCSSSANS